jgi:molybdopterin molybdotransferase
VEWQEARSTAHAVASALPPEAVPLDAAVGRTLAVDLIALYDVPHYASSAMDGWAVAGEPPWRLRDTTGARVEPGESLEPGEATAIVTGGLVAGGARGILRSEHGTVDSSVDPPVLSLNERAEPGEPRANQHIRPAGEEARESELVFQAGAVLTPAHVAVAAGCGHDVLRVAAVPRVGLVFTGDEVVEQGIPAPGQVRDSFGPTLPSFVALLGGAVVGRLRLGDELASIVAALSPGNRELADAHVIVTTGGTGHSPADHLRSALGELNARILIDGVAMRPGAPALLAQLPDGRFVVALPGNPLAAMMGMLTLAQPLLAALSGAPLAVLPTVPVAAEFPGGGHRRTELVPYRLVDGVAVATGWRKSSMLRGLAEAHGVFVCPPGGVAAGAGVRVIPLPWHR